MCGRCSPDFVTIRIMCVCGPTMLCTTLLFIAAWFVVMNDVVGCTANIFLGASVNCCRRRAFGRHRHFWPRKIAGCQTFWKKLLFFVQVCDKVFVIDCLLQYFFYIFIIVFILSVECKRRPLIITLAMWRGCVSARVMFTFWPVF